MSSVRPAISEDATPSNERTVALVGNPSIGKSVLFKALTGVCVTVSGYPAPREVSRGTAVIGGGMETIAPHAASKIPMNRRF